VDEIYTPPFTFCDTIKPCVERLSRFEFRNLHSHTIEFPVTVKPQLGPERVEFGVVTIAGSGPHLRSGSWTHRLAIVPAATTNIPTAYELNRFTGRVTLINLNDRQRLTDNARTIPPVPAGR
jgi:hypothetical protein